MSEYVSRIRALLGRSTAALMLANLGAALAGVVTGVVAARTLGAEGRGDLAVIIFWPSLVATLVDFGIADAVTLRCARSPDDARAYHAIALRFALCAGLVGAAIGVASAKWLLRSDQERLLSDALLAFAYVPLSALAAVPVGTLLGLKRYRAVAAIRLGTATAYTASMLVAVAMGHGTVRVLMWLTIASRALPSLLAAPELHRALAGAAGSSLRRKEVASQARDGATLHGARLASVVVGSEDRAIASLALAQAEIGYWQVASALSVVLQFVSLAVSQHLYSNVASGGPEVSQRVHSAYVRAVILTSVVVLVGVPLLPVVVPLLYGAEFRAAVPPGIVVMGAAVVAAGVTVLQAGARASLRTRVCVEAEVVGGVVMALAAWPATDALGGLGLAMAYLAGRIASAAVMMRAAKSLFDLPARAMFPIFKEFYVAVRREWTGARRARSPAP